MNDATKTQLQTKALDFALNELVRQHRQSFQPLWTVDSWAKFLIWMALNCGVPGDRESLEQFADSLGSGFTTRMRRTFFERICEDQQIHLMADPSETEVLLMPITGSKCALSFEKAIHALDQVGLSDHVETDHSCWKTLEGIFAIPWITS